MGYKHFTYFDRIRIESWLRTGTPVKVIASLLGKAPASVYREIKRGRYEHRNSDYTTETRYSADIAEGRYRDNLKAKGPGLKIGSDYAFSDFIEYRIGRCRYSPEAVLREIKELGLSFKACISKTTLYRYIDKGLFLTVSNKSLPVKSRRKSAGHKKVHPSRAPLGMSIEQRPAVVSERSSFGHWEMDCVVGKKKTKPVLLVLTERLTRKELIYRMPDKKSASVVDVINRIYSQLGSSFGKLFKSITCDNGVEFADYNGITHDASGRHRVDLYYCHPYTSCERGSNENQNRLIRRFFPKGTSFAKTTRTEIARVEEWINNYPRKIFGGHTSNEMFDLCLRTVGI